MRKSVTVKINEEKLLALRKYTAQKGISLEDELEQAAEALFQKLVPASVKDYVDTMIEAQKPKKKSASSAVGQIAGD